jgi:hypothetical protein
MTKTIWTCYRGDWNQGDDRTLPFGPIAGKARQLYWDWAKA